MYARLQQVRTLPPQFSTPEASGVLLKVLEGHPGFRGAHLMLQIGTRQGLSLTLWDSREDAEAAPARTRAVMGSRPFPLAVDGLYDVLTSGHGPAALEDATVCQVTWFDGPRSAAQNEALRRAGEERIRPVVEPVPGFARTYVLCHPEDSSVVVLTLATSIDAIGRVADAVFSTSLLPGEDPALLDDPDRVEIYTVEAQSPAAVSAR
jgi:hypothetical protein